MFALLSRKSTWSSGLIAGLMLAGLPAASVVMSVAPASAAAGRVTNYTDTSIDFPTHITAGPDGALWFTNDAADGQHGPGSIGRITTAGAVSAFADSKISAPQGIAVGADGALWFGDQGRHSIGRITTTGVVSSFTDPSIGLRPIDITAGPDGALWFVNFDTNSIGRITTTGVVTNFTAAGVSNPIAITAGPDGALWFTNYSNNRIGRITTAGSIKTFTAPGIASFTLGIVTGPDGNLWFGNGYHSIGRITPAGEVATFNDSRIFSVHGIAAGPDGAVWFSNLDGGTVGRMTTSGKITNVFTDSTIRGPAGMVAGPDGAMWFTNVTGDSIGRITTRPGPPTLTGVTFGTAGSAGFVQVAFTPPSSDGGSAVIAYRAVCSAPGGDTRTGWATTSPALVANLTGLSTYTCAVRAVNLVGTGPASNLSTLLDTPAGLPAAPTAVTVTPLGTNAAMVAFTPGADGGNPIAGYTAVCTSTNGGKTRRSTAVTSPIFVTNLTHAALYACQVFALNRVGRSKLSTPSNSFLP